MITADRLARTWDEVPVRPNGHLFTESSPDEDAASIVQRPKETIVRTCLYVNQLDASRLHTHTGQSP